MDNLTSFITWLFNTVSDFLLSEPIIYIFYIVLAIFIVKLIRNLFTF